MFKKILNILDILRQNTIFKIFLIIILSFGLSITSLYYAKGDFGREMFFSYFNNALIILLNFLPVLWLMLLLYTLTGKTSISFFLTAAASYTITLVNYFKLRLRNDPLLMEDTLLIKEAFKIKNNYQFNFSTTMIVLIIFFIVLSILLYFFIDKSKKLGKISLKQIIFRIITSVIILIIGVVSLNTIYINKNIYAKTANQENINIWSQTQQYISRGSLYPFLYSYSSLQNEIPDGYNENDVKQVLSQYEYSNIPDDKKVNVISIMLEAYNDFTKFDSIEFVRNPYESFHKIQEESISGELLTNIFAAGTSDTERKFLTGYSTLPSFRKNTNSYVQYFNEQGYYTTGSHPCYNWFYNRINVNRNLGFKDYHFFEDRYTYLTGDTISGDQVLLPDIVNLYKSRDKSAPYFSFNVTYQNHGPYGIVDYYGTEYVKRKDNYTDEECNILNNYFWGIEGTSNEILNMINSLREDDSPVVVILFGDHNPWLGDNNSVYKMLGINLNLDTEEGIYNYYCTPYIIWANNKAKEVLQNDFIGKEETISPIFLMNKFFELAGFEGNEFMKASNALKENITAINDNFYIVNNQIERTLPDEYKQKLDEFKQIEYYWKNN